MCGKLAEWVGGRTQAALASAAALASSASANPCCRAAAWASAAALAFSASAIPCCRATARDSSAALACPSAAIAATSSCSRSLSMLQPAKALSVNSSSYTISSWTMGLVWSQAQTQDTAPHTQLHLPHPPGGRSI